MGECLLRLGRRGLANEPAKDVFVLRDQSCPSRDDAFVKILDINSKESIGSRSRYLMKMIRNLAIDHYRRQSLELRVFTHREDYATFVSETALPDNITIRRQALQTMAAALAELPERTRYAFEMHRVQGLSQKEIAIALGVSPRLVNFMIRDALVHCRKKLQGNNGDAQ